jgi:peptidoglycan/LPS O-acetylase OafA/YrhL
MTISFSTTVAQPRATPKVFNFNLEALRGVAALFVVWHHLLFIPGVLGLTPSGMWAFSAPGHLCVLVFFMLSGYVIGIAHPEPLTRHTIPSYLKKRALRLYPIYFISIVFTFLVAPVHYAASTIASHFAMAQVWLSPVVAENAPVWSLHYEVVYYLLFIPLALFRVPALVALLVSFGIGFANACLFHFSPGAGASPVLSSYAFGFTFWLSGLALARYKGKGAIQSSWAEMLSLLFLLLALERFNVLVPVLSKVSLRVLGTDLSFPTSVSWFERAIAFPDFAALPFCLLILAVFANKGFPGRNVFFALLMLAPVLTFYSFYKHYDSRASIPLLLPSLSYLVAVAIYMFRQRLESISKLAIKWLIGIGSLSYGLYIIHYPLLELFSRVQLFGGTVTLLIIRLLLFLLLTTCVAYLLEKKFQPWIKKLIQSGTLKATVDEARAPQVA